MLMKLKEFTSINSQRLLAHKVGVHPSLVCQWLSGKTAITAEKAIQIERATNGAVTREELRPDIFLRDGISHRSGLRPAELASSPRGSTTPARENEESHG